MKKPSTRSIARQKRANAKRVTTGSRRRASMQHRLIASAGALALGAFGSQALAAQIDVDVLGATFNVSGHLVIDSVQLQNADDIAASIIDGETNILGNVEDGSDVTFDVGSNVFGALASGNSFLNQIELSLIDFGAGAGGVGAATLGFSLNTGAITSTVEDSGFNQTLVGFESGTFNVSDNLVLAQTTLNSGETEVFGNLPNGYTDDTPGSISFGFPTLAGTNDLSTTATVAAVNFQLSQDAVGSAATVEDNFATLRMDADLVDITLTSSLTVDNNEFSASFSGNTSLNSVPILTGGNDTFVGTVALSNLQGNLNGGAPSATTDGTRVTASLGGLNDTQLLDFAGSLSVSDNTVGASATGNRASSEILLEDGMNFTGSANTGAPGVNIFFDSVDPETNAILSADLALLNAQGNQGTDLLSLTDDTRVAATLQSLNSGTVVLDANSINSSSIGNIASSSIIAESGNDLTGSVGLGSIQANEVAQGAGVSATTSDTTVEVVVGNTPAADRVVIDATISLTNTAVTASGTGNQVANTVDLTGNTVALGDAGAAASAASTAVSRTSPRWRSMPVPRSRTYRPITRPTCWRRSAAPTSASKPITSTTIFSAAA